VRKAAFPKASTILIRKDSTMKGQCSYTWSRSLRSDGHTDVRAHLTRALTDWPSVCRVTCLPSHLSNFLVAEPEGSVPLLDSGLSLLHRIVSLATVDLYLLSESCKTFAVCRLTNVCSKLCLFPVQFNRARKDATVCTYPNRIAHAPVVKMPPLNSSFGPIRLSWNIQHSRLYNRAHKMYSPDIKNIDWFVYKHGEVLCSSLGRDTSYSDWVLSWFYQSFQANSGIVPRLSNDPPPSKFLQIYQSFPSTPYNLAAENVAE
jgi:hypothetical protein